MALSLPPCYGTSPLTTQKVFPILHDLSIIVISIASQRVLLRIRHSRVAFDLTAWKPSRRQSRHYHGRGHNFVDICMISPSRQSRTRPNAEARRNSPQSRSSQDWMLCDKVLLGVFSTPIPKRIASNSLRVVATHGRGSPINRQHGPV